MRDALTQMAAAGIPSVGEVHDVRVRSSNGAEFVNFHCLVDPMLPVAEVHEKVDTLERALRQRFPTIKRVIGHAEPARQASPVERFPIKWNWKALYFSITGHFLTENRCPLFRKMLQSHTPTQPASLVSAFYGCGGRKPVFSMMAA